MQHADSRRLFPASRITQLTTALAEQLALPSSASSAASPGDLHAVAGARCAESAVDQRTSAPAPDGSPALELAFHRLGHFLQDRWTRQHALEFRYFGDPAPPEAFAQLIEELTISPAWLRTHLRLPAESLRRYLRLRAFARLSNVRLSCRAILLARELDLGTISPDLLGPALLPSSSTRPRDITEGSTISLALRAPERAVTTFRSSLLAASLRHTFSSTFGPNWYENDAARQELHTLLAHGRQWTTDALTGGSPVTAADIWIAELEYLLHFSSPR